MGGNNSKDYVVARIQKGEVLIIPKIDNCEYKQ